MDSAILVVAMGLGWVAPPTGDAPASAPPRLAAPPLAPPRRIITIGPNAAEIICELGAANRLIAVDRFCVFPPDLATRPRIGGLFDPDLERIAALRPDLIVVRGRSEAIERLATERGVALYHDETDSLAGVEKCVIDLGRLLAKEREAGAIVSRFRDRIEAIRARAAGRPRPRVVVIPMRQPDRLANLLTAGRGTFLDEMIDIAGGVNVFGYLDMAYPQISPEAILTRRPDVILEMMPEVNVTPELRARMIEQWRSLGSIPAVTTARVHFITDDNALIPSPRYVEIVEKIARILHPEGDLER